MNNKLHYFLLLPLIAFHHISSFSMHAGPWCLDLSEQSALPFFPVAAVVDEGHLLPGENRADTTALGIEYVTSYALTSKHPAKYWLALLKLIYLDTDGALVAFGGWVGLLREVISANNNIQNDDDAEQRVKSHASIWKSRITIKYAVTGCNKNHKQSLLFAASKLLHQSHSKGVTDSCLIWEAEIYLRYGLRIKEENGTFVPLTDREAVAIAENLLNTVGKRRSKSKLSVNETSRSLPAPVTEPADELKCHNEFLPQTRKLEAELREELSLQQDLLESEDFAQDIDMDSSGSSDTDQDYDNMIEDSYELDNPIIPVVKNMSLKNAFFKKHSLKPLQEAHPKFIHVLSTIEQVFASISAQQSKNIYSYGAFLLDLTDALGKEYRVTIYTGSADQIDLGYHFPLFDPASNDELILYRARQADGRGKWHALEKAPAEKIVAQTLKRKRSDESGTPSKRVKTSSKKKEEVHLTNSQKDEIVDKYLVFKENPKKKFAEFARAIFDEYQVTKTTVSSLLKKRGVYQQSNPNRKSKAASFTDSQKEEFADAYSEYLKVTHIKTKSLETFLASEEGRKFNISVRYAINILKEKGITRNRSLSMEERVAMVRKYLELIKDDAYTAEKRNKDGTKTRSAARRQIVQTEANSKALKTMLCYLGANLGPNISVDRIKRHRFILQKMAKLLEKNDGKEFRGWKSELSRQLGENISEHDILGAQLYQACIDSGVLKR